MEDNKAIFQKKIIQQAQKKLFSKVADTINELFSNVVKELKIEQHENFHTDDIEETDPVLKAIKKIQKSSKYFANKKLF